MENEKKENLIMKDLYFSKFSFTNNKITGQAKLHINYEVKFMLNDQNKNFVKAQIDTTILSDNNCISLDLQTVGIFEIADTTLDDEQREIVLKTNAVATMFPYIRSQVSLLTTQPGLTPILLQPVDVNSLIKMGRKSLF